jgi:23S rRNA pseudouridine955/2504/2580 synthase/23S rRNA pseudouridine1911/1915/1917 synthase
MLDILHQDDHIIVINKPAGLSVLPEGWDPEAPYLRQMLEEEYKRIWVVHRLDKVTSGVMVFALTAEAHRGLNRQFEKHVVEKVYQAIVEGVPPWDVRNARHMLQTNVGRKHRTVVVHKRGKNSETDFKVLRRGQVQALVEAHPKTGRTHQVRVHLSALGFPILDDTLYGASESDLIERPALHAYSLGITHPISGERLNFIANPPTDFQEVLKRLDV